MGAIRVIRGILAAIWCCLLPLSLWLTVQRQVFQQEEISLAGVTLAPVEGDAMSPTLREGDGIFATPAKSDRSHVVL